MTSTNNTARVIKSNTWGDGSKTVTIEIASYDSFLTQRTVHTQTHSMTDQRKLAKLCHDRYGIWID